MADPQENDEWLRLPAVVRETGLKASTILEWARNDKFPKQIRLSHKVSVWSRRAILEWKASKAKGA